MAGTTALVSARSADLISNAQVTPVGELVKRFGRTVIGYGAASAHRYAGHIVGSDHADYSGDCSSPVFIPLVGVKSLALDRVRQYREREDMDYAEGFGHIGPGFEEPGIRHVDIAARCRKCPACLKARSYHWTERAFVECGRSNRTWFGTLTLRPEMHFRCLAIAANKLAVGQSGVHHADDEAFKEVVKPLTAEFQRYMKRLRKNHSGLRYLATVEKHVSGLPHMHVLVHETGEAVTHRALSSAWHWGFTKYKLVPSGDERRASRYVCKYLTKSLLTRIVASRSYGK